MKQLSKDEMKKVMGGVMAPPGNTICGDNRIAHCTWKNGACVDQAWGYCGAGTEATCDMYCVRSDGSTYDPGNC